MSIQHQLSVEIYFVNDGSNYYLDINNYYFFPGSNICGSTGVTFISIDKEQAERVIDRLKLTPEETPTHIYYRSKARLRHDKLNKAARAESEKRKAQKVIV